MQAIQGQAALLVVVPFDKRTDLAALGRWLQLSN